MSKLEDIIARGTRSGQPTPTTGTMEGYLYFVTDEGVVERWSGSAWESYSGAGGGGGGGSTAVSIIAWVIDGAGAEVTTGYHGDRYVNFDGTIAACVVLADQTGDIEFDIWKDTYANFPPDSGDTIVASAPPAITAGVKSRDATLTGWDTAVAAGDVFRLDLVSVADIEFVAVFLEVIPS